MNMQRENASAENRKPMSGVELSRHFQVKNFSPFRSAWETVADLEEAAKLAHPAVIDVEVDDSTPGHVQLRCSIANGVKFQEVGVHVSKALEFTRPGHLTLCCTFITMDKTASVVVVVTRHRDAP